METGNGGSGTLKADGLGGEGSISETGEGRCSVSDVVMEGIQEPILYSLDTKVCLPDNSHVSL